MKTRYDSRATDHHFKEGDLVWMYNLKRQRVPSPKLQHNWEGSYTIVKKLNDVVYRVQRSPNAKPNVIHINQLAPYRTTDYISIQLALLDELEQEILNSETGKEELEYCEHLYITTIDRKEDKIQTFKQILEKFSNVEVDLSSKAANLIYGWRSLCNIMHDTFIEQNTMLGNEVTDAKSSTDLQEREITVRKYEDAFYMVTCMLEENLGVILVKLQELTNKDLELKEQIAYCNLWIPAHTGIQGNETVDSYAKKGTTRPNIEKIPKKSFKQLKNAISNVQIQIWQERWASSTTKNGRHTEKLIPAVSIHMKKFSHFIVQFLSGHGRYPAYFVRFGRSLNIKCPCGAVGDTLHYVVNCPFTEKYAKKLIYDKDNLSTILNREENLGLLHSIYQEVNNLVPQV
ncbi:hypothetical protein AVEN_126019-1 [Araneus ventricosus]|uniref:Integrase p58-like C-terminal domain-containing protein n=1 Tax=Araneus ventricosus TaxID=182803 RepID=A0A4Y2VR77_ARAVE|nr:hypothetical protein AVEN_126019-1 [Araneus ventricosus]